MMGFIVDCEAFEQVEMQYDRCEIIMACMLNWAELNGRYFLMSLKQFADITYLLP